MLTIIREVTYDAESTSLLFNPIEEISELRGKRLYCAEQVKLHHESSAAKVHPHNEQTQ